MAGSDEVTEGQDMSPPIASFIDENNEYNGIRRMGYLKKLKTMKKKFYVLREPTEKQPAVLEYYNSEKMFRKGSNPKKIIVISGAFAINKKEDGKVKHVISIFQTTETQAIVANSDREQNEWLRDLLELQKSRAGNLLMFDPVQKLSPRFDFVWDVTVTEKGLALARGIRGPHRLCLSDRTVKLFPMSPTSDNDAIIFPLVTLRKVGHNDLYFYLEVGRHASTGSGEFCMGTESKITAQHIHETLSEAMRKGGGADETGLLQSTDHRIRSNTGSQQRRLGPGARRNTYDTARVDNPTGAPATDDVKTRSISAHEIAKARVSTTLNPILDGTPEYIQPKFAQPPSNGDNYLAVNPSEGATTAGEYMITQPTSLNARATNYTAVTKAENFNGSPVHIQTQVPPTERAEQRVSMSPPTIPEETDYFAMQPNQPVTSGSETTLVRNPTPPISTSSTETGYFEMNYPNKCDRLDSMTSKSSGSFSSAFSSSYKMRIEDGDSSYMVMGPSSGASSSGVSDSRRSTMSNSSYHSHNSEKDESPSSNHLPAPNSSDVTYTVMEPVNPRFRSRENTNASWDNSTHSIGTSPIGWDRFSSFGMRPEYKLEKVRAFMTLDDPNKPELREVRAYSMGNQPKPEPTSFNAEVPSTSADRIRTRAYSLGTQSKGPTSRPSFRKMVHCPSANAIETRSVSTSSPTGARVIRQVSTSDSHLNPDSGSSTPVSGSEKPLERKATMKSVRDEDLMEVTFRPKTS